MPATRSPFSTEEWAWVVEYATNRSRGTAARSRAARIAHSVALEALSWMTPLPRKCDGRSRSSTIQSSMSVSTSVTDGLVAQLKPLTPRPDEARSPRIDGNDVLAGK